MTNDKLIIGGHEFSSRFILGSGINEFVRTTTDDFKINYPSANYLVEYIFNKYEEIALFFKVENDKIILVGLKEYAVFRP